MEWWWGGGGAVMNLFYNRKKLNFNPRVLQENLQLDCDSFLFVSDSFGSRSASTPRSPRSVGALGRN